MSWDDVAKLLPALLFVALFIRRAIRMSRTRSNAPAPRGPTAAGRPPGAPAPSRPVTPGRRGERVAFARDYEPIEPR